MDHSVCINPASRDPFQSRDKGKRPDFEIFKTGDAVSIKETLDRHVRYGWISGRTPAIEHAGTALDNTEGRRFLVEMLDGTTGNFDAKSLNLYSTRKKPSWEQQPTQPTQAEIRAPPMEQIQLDQRPPREYEPMATRQTEIRQMEEVDQEPELQQEAEPPTREDTPARRIPAARKPRGTALMDEPGWSNCDEGNIIRPEVEGRCTRSNRGETMQAEVDQEDIGAGVNLFKMVFTNWMQAAVKTTLKEAGLLENKDSFKDEEEDSKSSIAANSPRRENQLDEN